MSNTNFEKVLLDTTFKHCQSTYDRLSNALNDIDTKKVCDIKELNKKILALSNEMHKLLCIAESVKICDQKLPGAIPQKVSGKNQKPKYSEDASISKTSEAVSKLKISRNIMTKIYIGISYKGSDYKCNFCDVNLKNIEEVLSHIDSQEHRDIFNDPSACFSNVLRDDCNIAAFWSIVPSNLKINTPFIQPIGFTCTLCKCSLPYSIYGIYKHILGKNHLKNVPKILQEPKLIC